MMTLIERLRADAEHSKMTEFLDRKRMQLIAAFDLGQDWTRMAEGPTFFCIDNKGNIQPPPDDHAAIAKVKP